MIEYRIHSVLFFVVARTNQRIFQNSGYSYEQDRPKARVLGYRTKRPWAWLTHPQRRKFASKTWRKTVGELSSAACHWQRMIYISSQTTTNNNQAWVKKIQTTWALEQLFSHGDVPFQTLPFNHHERWPLAIHPLTLQESTQTYQNRSLYLFGFIFWFIFKQQPQPARAIDHRHRPTTKKSQANATFLRRFVWRDLAYWFLWDR